MTIKELKTQLNKFDENDEVLLKIAFDGDSVCNPLNLVKGDSNRACVTLEYNKTRETLEPLVKDILGREAQQKVFLNNPVDWKSWLLLICGVSMLVFGLS